MSLYSPVRNTGGCPLFLLLFFCSAALISGCQTTAAGRAAAVPENVFALVDDVPVLTNEVQEELAKLPYYQRLQIEHDPALRAHVIDNYLTSRLLLLEAAKLDLEESDSFTTLLHSAAQTILLQLYMEHLVSLVPEPQEADIEQYYTDRSDYFMTPAAIRVAFIRVSTEAEADSIVRRFREGTPFEDIMQLYPERSLPDALWNEANIDRHPQLKELVWDLPVGDVAEPYVLEAPDIFVVKKLADVPEQLPPLETIHDQVSQAYRKEQVDIWITAYIATLKREHPIKIMGDL